MALLVTGGTGVLGRALAVAAGQRRQRVRLGSRRPPPGGPADPEWVGMDIATGAGLAEALAGVDCVIHAATDPRRPAVVDVAGTRRLLEAAHAAGVRHLVFVSVVGIDRIPVAYYRHKLVAERIVEDGPVPYSILRITQFHPFVDTLLAGASRFPVVMPLPAGFSIQSVAPSDAATRLLDCAAAGPAGRRPDFGGPEVLTLREAATAWKAARSVRKRIVPVPVLGRVGAGFRAGANTAPEGERGTVRWEDWLAQ